MSKLPVIIAAASTLLVVPAFAGQLQSGQSQSGLKGKAYGYERESEMGPYGERYGEREGTSRYPRGEYYREGMSRYPRAEYYREGCKYITIRQRHGDEIVIRRFKRCD